MGFLVTFEPLWGRTPRVTFEPLFRHFNSFGVSGLLEGHSLHNNHFSGHFRSAGAALADLENPDLLKQEGLDPFFSLFPASPRQRVSSPFEA